MLLFVSVLGSLSFNAQISPGIEWRKSTWSPRGLDLNFQTQEQSGEEWWYSHKNIYNAQGTHTAYITVGYTSLVSTQLTYSNAQQFYNEGPDSPYNPIDPVSYNYSTLNEGCGDRDFLGEHRTPPRGNLGMNALDGSMIYCKPKTIGGLEEVIQDPSDPNYFYVVGVHVGVRPYKNKTNFIPYNPTAGANAQYFSLSAMGVSNYTNSVDHFYVAKCNVAGDVVWEGLYGFPEYSVDPFLAYRCRSYGYDIIKSSKGTLVACGFALISDNINQASRPFILELDPLNGYVLNKALLPSSGNGLAPVTNTVTGYVKSGVAHSIEEIASTKKYACATTYFFGNSTYYDSNNAFLWGIDEQLNLNSNWNNNPYPLIGNGPELYGSIVWEVMYHQALKQLLVPVIRDCGHCATAGENAGNAYMYRFDTLGKLISAQNNPAFISQVNAFDLRAGVTETKDGGFAVVSSVRAQPFVPPTTSELGYLANCSQLNYTDWDTDAMVAKFSATGNLQWKKIFDCEDGRMRQPPPGDLKRQECVYKITEAQSGGLVISGNSSGNFDDFYMAKLYDDCNASQTYTFGPDFELHVKGKTTWSNSMNVIGKVILDPGAQLIIKGANTKIRFADSKLSGIETFIQVKSGGKLTLEDGASIGAIDSVVCKNSSWGGIVYESNSFTDEKLVLFPNPAKDDFTLYIPGDFEDGATYMVTDLLGKKLLESPLVDHLAVNVNTAGWSKGLYYVSIMKDKRVIASAKLLLLN